MVGNSFKRGMEAGAKPFEEKFRRQEQAIRRVGETISEQTGEIKEVLDVVIDELSALQKKELYDLNTPFDLKELDGADKELLVAGLYTLSAMTEQPTEHQQAFLRSVQAYLRIREAQALVELSAVENVESLTAQKAILQAFMEFLFLEREDDSFLEAYEELFEYFSVNRKTRQGILESIHNIYRAAGAKGVAEKYGFVPPPGGGGAGGRGKLGGAAGAGAVYR